MQVTVDILKAIAPGGRQSNYRLFPDIAQWMNYWFPKYDIDTKGELCHFIAQAAHETNSFNTLQEYASGDAYDTRVDLGNTPERDGDGRKYKGRGIFQVTGRQNYRIATIEWAKRKPATYLNFVVEPHYLEVPQFAVWSACQYWDQRDLSTYANMPDVQKIWVKKFKKDIPPVEYITYRINGGFNHLKERKQFYERAKAVLI